MRHGRGANATLYSSVLFILTRNKSTTNPTFTASTVASQLGNSLLVAFVIRALCKNGGVGNLEMHDIPLSEDLVLEVLRRNSLDMNRKVDFFKWCSLRPNHKHSVEAYSEIFRSLCRSNAHRHEIFDLLTSMKRDGLVLDSSTFKLILDVFIRSGKFDSALEILDHMEEELGRATSSLNPDVYSSVLVALVRKGQISLALPIFFKLLEPSNVKNVDAFVCNELLVALRKADMKTEFIQVFDKLRANKEFALDLWGYNICIHAFGCWGALGMSLNLFKEMKERSQSSDGSFGPDLCTYNSLIHALCVSGKVKDAVIAWEELKESGHEPDAFTYRILIQGCCRSYRIEDATRIFSEMQYNGFCPDTIIYNSMLDGLLKARRLAEACQLFEKMIEDGIRASCWTYNILIDGLFKNGRAVAGYTMFCDLKKKGQFVDAVTYSIVILHLCREDQLEEALQLADEMEARGFVVDLVTITSLLVGLHRQGRWDWMERLLNHIRDGNLLPAVLKWKANMDSLMKTTRSKRKDLTPLFPSENDLSDILSSMTGDSRLDVDHGSEGSEEEELSSFDSNDWSSSPHMDRLANQITGEGHSFPMVSLSRGKRVLAKHVDSFDVNMVNTYLAIFLAKGNLSLACKLFEIFNDMGVNLVGYTYNSMMCSFVKKGYFDEAWGVLHEMGEKLCPADIATYNVIIHGLGKMGKADLASAVLDMLVKHGGYLDIVMYNTLINALGKGGRINEANKLFEQMKSSGINPDVVTFNTLIEVHAKAGRLQDAYKFLKMMLDTGCSPNHVTDTTLDFLEKEIEKQRYQKASIKGVSKDGFC